MKWPSFKKIRKNILQTFTRFPLALLSALIGVGLKVYSIEYDGEAGGTYEMIMTAMLGVFFFTALSLFCRGMNKTFQRSITGMGIVFIGLYFLSLLEISSSPKYLLMKQFFLCLSSFIAIIWAPFWNKKTKNETIWEWVRKIIMNLGQTIFFGVLIFAGVSGAIAATNALFEIGIDGRIYFQILTLVAGGFGPIFFLGNLDEAPESVEIPQPIPIFMKILTKYILGPLTVLYFIILYTYTFKILVTGGWPKNILGWLIICFSVVAIFTYFLWTPFLSKKIIKYRRIFWWGLLPQIAMLFVAIGVRIQTYSWTENRYLVVILGTWLLGITFYFLIHKKAALKNIFITLTAVILFSQLGPLNIYSVGEKSQKQLLIKLLENSNILQNGEIIPSKVELDIEIRREISGKIKYLIDNHGKNSVSDVFPKIIKKLEIEIDKEIRNHDLMVNITKELGFEFVSAWQTNEEYLHEFYFSPKWGFSRNIAGYDWFIPNTEMTVFLEGKNLKISVNSEKESIEIWKMEALKTKKTFKNKELLETINLSDFFSSFTKDEYFFKKRNIHLDPNSLVYEYDGKKIKAKIFFPHITVRKDRVKSFSFDFYLSFKERLQNASSEKISDF